jgi:hypothetical protein
MNNGDDTVVCIWEEMLLRLEKLRRRGLNMANLVVPGIGVDTYPI